MSEVGSYLQELQAEGQVDSRGVFTVDMARALEKVGRFQLPSPYHYVLSLVSCGVALEVAKIDIAGSVYQREFEMRGGGFSSQEMQDLFGSFLSSSSHSPRPKALRNLALAIYAVAQLPGMVVTGRTCDGTSGAAIGMDHGRLTITPLTSTEAITTLHFGQSRSKSDRAAAGLRWLAGLSPPRPDVELLRRYCRFCPVPSSLNDQELCLKEQGKWDQLVTLNRARIRRELKPKRVKQELTMDREVPFCGYLGTAPEGGGLALIVDGLYYENRYPAPDTTFRALIWHDHLNRDLSMMNLVDDPLLKTFYDQLTDIYQEIGRQTG